MARCRSVTPITPELSKLMPSIADHTITNHVIKSKSASIANPRNYYNTAREIIYPRFSTTEWVASNKANLTQSDRERNQAERLRCDAFQAVKTTDQTTRNRQAVNTKKLGVRVSDISFWKEELLKEINMMENECNNLEEHKRILEKAFTDTKFPLSIAEDCLMQREHRIGIDLVHDNVELALSKEVDVIRRCQNKMKKLIDKSIAQLKMNRACQKVCDLDAKDKNHAHVLDDRMYQLRNSSSRIGFYPGIENMDNTKSIPFTWMKYTQENIARSQKERENSERIRGFIDTLLRSCANEMWSQFNSVNNAFSTRMKETNDAKNILQAHLQKTNNEIRDMERIVELLRKSIFDKEAPMKVAQTRLDERSRRINVELCNDPVMAGLQKEVYEIRESVRILKEKLQLSQNALNRLMKTRATLESDISVKETSLEIDSKRCMGSRKNMPMDPRTGPIYSMPIITY